MLAEIGKTLSPAVRGTYIYKAFLKNEVSRRGFCSIEKRRASVELTSLLHEV